MGFGALNPPTIITQLQRSYGKPSYQNIKANLERLNEPMDRAQPIEVMLRNIEQVQRFLLQNPEEDRQLTQVNLIGYAVIKLSETGGMYQKALKKWHLRDVDDRKSWAAFSKFMVEQYERLLKLGTGITIGQEGYGTAFHATTATNGSRGR